MIEQEKQKITNLEAPSPRIAFPADLVDAYNQRKMRRKKMRVLVSSLSVFLVAILATSVFVLSPKIPQNKVVKG
ncbi:MAG: hypothetical protein NTY04_03840, partial [Candidatus Staskawiczbacteria bacterium]|nr:hypothetical protein [Candidatus Staskawiczbacteria bacterium]